MGNVLSIWTGPETIGMQTPSQPSETGPALPTNLLVLGVGRRAIGQVITFVKEMVVFLAELAIFFASPLTVGWCLFVSEFSSSGDGRWTGGSGSLALA